MNSPPAHSQVSKVSHPLKLPTSIKTAAARLAKEDGVSLNQWIASAVAQKVSAAAHRCPLPHQAMGRRPGRVPVSPAGRSTHLAASRRFTGDALGRTMEARHDSFGGRRCCASSWSRVHASPGSRRRYASEMLGGIHAALDIRWPSSGKMTVVIGSTSGRNTRCVRHRLGGRHGFAWNGRCRPRDPWYRSGTLLGRHAGRGNPGAHTGL